MSGWETVGFLSVVEVDFGFGHRGACRGQAGFG